MFSEGRSESANNGIPIHSPLGEIAVDSIADDTGVLVAEPPILEQKTMDRLFFPFVLLHSDSPVLPLLIPFIGGRIEYQGSGWPDHIEG